MSVSSQFANIKVKNPNNEYLVREFIRYHRWIYSNYSNSQKTSKENYYKLLVIKKTIEIIAKFPKDITDGAQLEHIKGIGEKTINRINEIIKTGKLSEIDDTTNKKTKQISAVQELSTIYGIGPSKASEFYEKHNITTIKQLMSADKKGIIQLTEQMKLGIKYNDILIQKIPRILIASLDLYLTDCLYRLDKDFIGVICGSYRREKDYSSDVDILITHKKINSKDNIKEYLKKIIDTLSNNIIIDALTVNYNTHFQGFATFKNLPTLPTSSNYDNFDVNKNVFRLDIIFVPINSFYTALMHFTGSGDFNQRMRLHAKSLGYKLSEYGLSTIKNNKETFFTINSEKDIFDLLLLKYLPPSQR